MHSAINYFCIVNLCGYAWNHALGSHAWSSPLIRDTLWFNANGDPLVYNYSVISYTNEADPSEIFIISISIVYS